MKGYISFVLVFLSSLILLHSLAILNSAYSTDLSQAVETERAYGLAMNTKECVLESIRQGAARGFSIYDETHDISLCRHCPDHFCTPPTPLNPNPENICDVALCGQCFRESEARLASESGALSDLMALGYGSFDSDYSVFLDEAVLEASLEADGFSKNGLRLSSVRFREDFPIVIESKKFGFRGVSEIKKGMVVPLGAAYD
ncbi:MAG: hypothetical protein V1861_00775 [Candidatus Micrarchaeota archaeon]